MIIELGYFIFVVFLSFVFYACEVDYPTTLDLEKMRSAEYDARYIVDYVDEISELQYKYPELPITEIPSLIKEKEAIRIFHVSSDEKLYLWVNNEDSLYSSLNDALGGSLVLGYYKQGVILNSFGSIVDARPPQGITEGSLVIIFRN